MKQVMKQLMKKHFNKYNLIIINMSTNAFVLHHTHNPNSRLIIQTSFNSNSMMLGFSSKVMSSSFSKLILKNYKINPVVSIESRVFDDISESEDVCSNVRMVFPLEKSSSSLYDILSLQIHYEEDALMFQSMVRHSIDFMLIEKYGLDWFSVKSSRGKTMLKPHLTLDGVHVTFSESDTKNRKLDKVDLLKLNRNALENLWEFD
tara:strand:+ start:1267 stop:1878 length:612 start_codon:yes stop_codon:yes gene_type:complete